MILLRRSVLLRCPPLSSRDNSLRTTKTGLETQQSLANTNSVLIYASTSRVVPLSQPKKGAALRLASTNTDRHSPSSNKKRIISSRLLRITLLEVRISMLLDLSEEYVRLLFLNLFKILCNIHYKQLSYFC